MDAFTLSLVRNRVRTATVADVEELALALSDTIGSAQLATLIEVATAEQKRREKLRGASQLTILGV